MFLTLYGYLIFVISDLISGLNRTSKRKNYIIIDIHELNRITVINTYLILLELNVIPSSGYGLLLYYR